MAYYEAVSNRGRMKGKYIVAYHHDVLLPALGLYVDKQGGITFGYFDSQIWPRWSSQAPEAPLMLE